VSDHFIYFLPTTKAVGSFFIRTPTTKAVGYFIIRAPTTKAVGSELVAIYQPTALVVGDAKK
jgi:hypothetical protein